MSVSANELIPVVARIHASSTCEADWRCVCSRAYYAVYQDVVAFHDSLPSPGVAPSPTRGKHESLVERLTNPTIRLSDPLHMTSRRVGHITETLRQRRVTADYLRDDTIRKVDADICVARANEILDIVQDFAMHAHI